MRGCAVNLWECMPHHSDHLAPLCERLQIPLLVSDSQHADWARDHYPGVEVRYLPPEQQTPAYFFQNFDVLYRANIWNMPQVRAGFAPLEEAFGKRLHVVHLPHGMSDKTYWFERLRVEEVVLVFGESLRNFLMETGIAGALKGMVTVGNLRWDYYRAHRVFLDQKAEEEVFCRFAARQYTVLYAPTWADTENATSFYEALGPILDDLPDAYNLLVKLHPYLKIRGDRALEPFLAPYQGKKNVVFLQDHPYVYPLLARADAYIGDTSSVGYDYLVFNRPMFFLNQAGVNPEEDPRFQLAQCGRMVDRSQYGRFWQLFQDGLVDDEARYSALRQKRYAKSFSEGKEGDELKADLESVLGIKHSL